jgi:hypothetical protein
MGNLVSERKDAKPDALRLPKPAPSEPRIISPQNRYRTQTECSHDRIDIESIEKKTKILKVQLPIE